MALKLTVTPSTKYIEDSINIKITGGTIPNNLQLFVLVSSAPEGQASYGVHAYVQESGINSNFDIICPSSTKRSPSGYNYGLPYVYEEDFTLNTDKLNYVNFYLQQGEQVITSVTKTLYIKPDIPTFTTTPTYVDTDPDANGLTNDNQMIVRGLSKIRINNLTGTAKKAATLKSIKVNDLLYDYNTVINDNQGNIDIDLSTNNIKPYLDVSLIDSRGFTNTLRIADIDKFKYTYQVPRITNMSIERDGVSETSILNVSGYYSEGYLTGTNLLTGNYEYRENVSGSTTETGLTVLNITKDKSYAYQDFLDILEEYNNPSYIVDSQTNDYYYEKSTFDNGINDLFSTAILYNNKYNEEYLQLDYNSTTQRYYCLLGGYNNSGQWKQFWYDTLIEIDKKMYGDNIYGTNIVGDEDAGNYSFEIQTAIQGDTASGFSLGKSFYVTSIIGDSIRAYYGNRLRRTELLLSSTPAIDVVGNKLALHGIYDETLGGDIQFNGDIFVNGKGLYEQKILWEGAIYMNGTQEAQLSEKISEQKSGVVLMFSAYANNQAQNYDWHSFFIPKTWVYPFQGNGMDFPLFTSSLANVGAKYIYFYDDHLKGHANNQATGTGSSGIAYKNNYWVLRYVIGV